MGMQSVESGQQSGFELCVHDFYAEGIEIYINGALNMGSVRLGQHNHKLPQQQTIDHCF